MSATVLYDKGSDTYWLVDNWTEHGTNAPLGVYSRSKSSIMEAALDVAKYGKLTTTLTYYLTADLPLWIKRILT